MGDEIGVLFLNSDFRSRSATKSYLQSIHMLSEDILGEYDDSPNVKGYILAALARSHKGSYGEFAGTTFEYLKDANFSGLTPEFVAFELFERGVLSFMSSMLLNIVTDRAYNTMSVQNQTSMVKSLGLAPIDIENFSGLVEKARQKAETTIREVITNDVNVLEALHRIGSGRAFAKQAECLCLLSAINLYVTISFSFFLAF